MVKIIGTGLSGLVGSRLLQLLPYEFESISRKEGVDIQDRGAVLAKIGSSDASVVLHLAGKTDVDACEKEKQYGEDGETWKINVIGTKNIIEACQKSGKKLIYISTDFVFDGNLLEPGYSEESIPHPINWYGQTKYEAEKIVQSSGLQFIIARIAYPFGQPSVGKRSFLENILLRLKKGEIVSAITDHIMTPTFIDDIARGFSRLIESDVTGIYHVVGSQFISPYDVAARIASVFNLDASLVQPISRVDFFRDRAPRPFNLSLKNDKIKKMGVTMSSFDEGLLCVKEQINI